ncbi:hypothetical protein K469DRAFT_726336 [Zopfia rhizophila CBS 207.26]|uniref:Uncharacterized protein n=1 Tax=Zopfia rhizophila CBS 207.26 TaxID=1314779 RepID=A0A6A6E578_9PEZI|nr:hypothetical protein K469DRAFT_726336 [Zopfia rhizophila CBS 207.26]
MPSQPIVCPTSRRSLLRQQDASCVRNLKAAGAVLAEKRILGAFATGLVGTRSPYGAVLSTFDPRYVSGGSSSGSASVIARGLVSFALGTDTASSGRVPAGLTTLAMVAERYAAIKPFIEQPDTRIDSIVRGVIEHAQDFTAADFFKYEYLKVYLIRQIERQFAECDATFVPTRPTFSTIEEVRIEPVLENSKLEAYTNFFTLLVKVFRKFKPGPQRVHAGAEGAHIDVQMWDIPSASFRRFLANVSSPLAICFIELIDGCWVNGFVCKPFALADALDITAFGSWVAYLNSLDANADADPYIAVGGISPSTKTLFGAVLVAN